MTAQAEKILEKHPGEKAAGQTIDNNPVKPADKPAEKRRALGRGLESLLPGPRALTQVTGERSQVAEQFPVPSSQFSVSSSPIPVQTAEPPSQGSTGTESAEESEGTAVPAIIPELQAVAETRRGTDGLPIVEIAIDKIDKNPHQTRSTFEKEELAELAASIVAQGVIQPIVVRPGKEGRYILILGERRLRASKLVDKTTIPAIVKRVSEQQAAEMTLVENLQRQDLNCMDQAEAFKRLSEDFQLTQLEIANRVGVSRQTVANYMRLIRLPGMTKIYLQNGDLSYSHARELLVIEDDWTLEKMGEKAVKEKLSVDRLEELITEMQFNAHVPEEYPGATKQRRGARWVDPNVKAAQRNLETILGMKVRIRDRKGKGTIRIEYTTLEDYDRVVALLKGKK